METSGILLIDKPAGPSSAQVLRIISRQLGLPKQVKIGHAGTLDPFATGLLVVLLGKACRLADFFQAGDKIYSGEIQLGITTDSDDITGEVLSQAEHLPEFSDLKQIADLFKGKIEQLPPSISALKVNGKRAYALKRSGIEPELKARPVSLHKIEVSSVSGDRASFRIECSKGFYVRSLARDIGIKLGCGACLKTLRREASWPFDLTNAMTIEELKSLEDKAFLSLNQAFNLLSFEEILVDEPEFSRLRNGLIPTKLKSSLQQKLDSAGQGLIVYKRNSDQQAGGLIKQADSEISILINF